MRQQGTLTHHQEHGTTAGRSDQGQWTPTPTPPGQWKRQQHQHHFGHTCIGRFTCHAPIEEARDELSMNMNARQAGVQRGRDQVGQA